MQKALNQTDLLDKVHRGDERNVVGAAADDDQALNYQLSLLDRRVP